MSTIEYQQKDESQAGSLEDQRQIIRSQQCDIVAFALGIIPPFHMQVHFRKLHQIDAILDVNIRSVSPEACVYGVCQKKITRDSMAGHPIVGFTCVGITFLGNGLTATGVTVCSEVVVVGW